MICIDWMLVYYDDVVYYLPINGRTVKFDIRLNLLYSKCVPIVTYAAQVKSFKYADMHACQVALNDAIRQIFGYNCWESIRSLRTSFGYNDLYHIFHHQSEQFGKQCRKHKNEIICALSRLE